MRYHCRREMLCINAIAWAGALGVIGLVAFDIKQHSLQWSNSGVGFIFAAVFFGQMLVSGRGLNAGAFMVALAAGSFPLWAEPGVLWFAGFSSTLAPKIGDWFVSMNNMLSVPVFMVCVSAIIGFFLFIATGSRGVGAQTVLAGIVAGACVLAPGDPALVFGAAGVLWSLIVFLSLSSWAHDYASRASQTRSVPSLGQSGPLASLVRGSTKHVMRRSDAA